MKYYYNDKGSVLDLYTPYRMRAKLVEIEPESGQIRIDDMEFWGLECGIKTNFSMFGGEKTAVRIVSPDFVVRQFRAELMRIEEEYE